VTTIRVGPLAESDIEAALPLFAGYQRFYQAEPDEQRNRAFFRRFLEPSDEGLLLGAWENGELLGFATIYWTHSSTRAADIALMNDLFVAERGRGRRIGERLIEACIEAAKARGLAHLEWFTATDNHTAQRLYDRIPGAHRSGWYAYEVDLASHD
jgi:GNAT superfamily N-acetyltransferase